MPTVILVTNPYLEPLFDGVADFAREHGWNLVTSMRRTGRFPAQVRPDAIVATVIEERIAEKLAEFTCPIVCMLNTALSRTLPYPRVAPDYTALGTLGARHLLQLGQPHLAFYRRFSAPDSTAVRDSFEAELARASRTSTRIDFPEEYPGLIDSGPNLQVSQEDWHARLGDRLDALPKPCAIMAEDDRYGIELIHLLRAHGYRVPEDVAVLGCDNLRSDLRLSPIPLSSVDANLEGVGYLAAQLLQRLLDGHAAPADPTNPIVAPSLGVIPRQSTATFVCADERISRIVCHLRSEFREPLTLSTLSRLAGMSIRSLQTAFKATLGHSIRDELLHCRMTCAERLLAETDLKLTAVAVESGFGDIKSLTRFFHQKHHQPPGAFRAARR